MLNAVRAEVGWAEGFALPILNAENKALEEEIQTKEKLRIQLEYKIGGWKDKIQAMVEHLKNLNQALSQTQSLRVARHRGTDSEKHIGALAEREAGHLRQEMGQLGVEMDFLRQKKKSEEDDIFKSKQKLEQLRMQLNWDQETLEACLDDAARKHEDTMAIIKYAQQDESRIKFLTAALENKSLEAIKKHKMLDNAVTETMTVQVGFDISADHFRQAHTERQELICEWENTITQMRKRDDDTRQCALQVAQVNQQVGVKSYTLNDQKTFLNNHMEDNNKLERMITRANVQMERVEQQYHEQETKCAAVKVKMETIKPSVNRISTDVESMGLQIISEKESIQDKTSKLKDVKLHNATVGAKLMTLRETVLNMDELAAQMEQLFKDDEDSLYALEVEIERHVRTLALAQEDLQTVRAKEKDMVAKMIASDSTLSDLDTNLGELDQDFLQHETAIYNQDFQIQQLQRKLARCQDQKSKDESILLKKTTELANAVDKCNKTAKMLRPELDQQVSCILRMRKVLEKVAAETREVNTTIEELLHFIDKRNKEMRELQSKKQNMTVDHKILHLEIEQLRALLYENEDGVLSQETRRKKMRMLMKEREREIRDHGEMLTKQVKTNDQERQMVCMKVNETQSKIDLMRKRYEILTFSMYTPEGEEERSEAYYIMKAAQEQEELKRKVDSLDREIRKKEMEIRAFENLLRLANSCNSRYRKSFTTVTEGRAENQNKLKLEEQERAALEKVKRKKRLIKELQEDIQHMDNPDSVLQSKVFVQNEQNEQTEREIRALKKGLASQNEKLVRVTKQCSKLIKEIRSSSMTREETFTERDIRLRELRDFNKTINNVLLEVMDNHPDLRLALQMYFLQAKLPLPSTAVSTSGSRSSSARSSVSLMSSISSASRSPMLPVM